MWVLGTEFSILQGQQVLITVERISYVCMVAAPVNNKSDGLWLRQEIGGGTSVGNSGRARHRRFTVMRGRDTWYLSTGNQTHGRL